MAIDGVKIIDGDTAYDVYGVFMDAYNGGVEIPELLEMYEQGKMQYASFEEEYEICVTVSALAFWEIGELTFDILAEVEAVIAKGACVALWTEKVGEKAGKARRKELDKLLAKISVPNPKIKQRKKYAKIKKLIFGIGDVLAFRFLDNTYGLTIVTDINQFHGVCYYEFCRTSFNSVQKPTMENVADLRVYGNLVPHGADYLNNSKLKMPWVHIIMHNDLKRDDFKSRFEKIGAVVLRCNHGDSGLVPTYEDFCSGFYKKKRECSNAFGREVGGFTVEELQGQPYYE